MVLRREITAQIKEVLEKHPEGLSITDLVKSVDINRNTAGRYLENLLLSGQVEMRRFGMAKMYTLAKRLPVSSVLSISSELVMQLDSGQRIILCQRTAPHLPWRTGKGPVREKYRIHAVLDRIRGCISRTSRPVPAGTEGGGMARGTGPSRPGQDILLPDCPDRIQRGDKGCLGPSGGYHRPETDDENGSGRARPGCGASSRSPRSVSG